MAYTFPLATAQFFENLPIKSLKFDAPEQVEVNQTGGGELLQADLAPMLWVGEVQLDVMTDLEKADAFAMLDILRPAGRTFYAYDSRRPGPLLDPTGTALGLSTPTIYSLPAGGREIRLQGLPVGYRLSRGDYIAFDYGSAPVRRALHRIVSLPTAAGGTGLSPIMEVTPMIRAGAVVGAAVMLVKASCKAIVVPNSIDTGITLKTITNGASFRFQQTLK